MASQNTRYISLDLLRGIAAGGVVLYHSAHYSINFFSPLYILVDLFFVLSGFVLQPIFPSDPKNPNSVKSFIKKRALRFWPMSVAALLTWSVWIFFQSTTGNISLEKYGTHPLLSLFSALLLLQIFSAPSVLWSAPLWSLSAEWFSNLIAIPVLLKKSIKLDAIVVVLGLVFVVVGLQTDQEFISDFGPIKGWEAIGRALAGLFVGIILRKKFVSISSWRIFSQSRYSVVSLIILYVLVFEFGYISVLVAPFLFAPLIVRLALANEFVSHSGLKRFSKVAGNLSFGIYVWHISFCDFFTGIFEKFELYPRTSPLISLILFVVTLTVSSIATLLTQKFIEKPIQTWFQNRNRENECKSN